VDSGRNAGRVGWPDRPQRRPPLFEQDPTCPNKAYFRHVDAIVQRAAHAHDNGLLIEADYGLEPTKPTLDGEPRYERVPAGFYLQRVRWVDRFDNYAVGQAAYWSLLAGACGFTYGNNNAALSDCDVGDWQKIGL